MARQQHSPEKKLIDHPDQVWSIDITYIPVKTDWLYLVASLSPDFLVF